MPTNRSPVPPHIQALAAAVSQVQPMRRGSMSERLMKCGKPACPCHTNPAARHGPYFSVTRGVKGQTTSRYVTPEQAVVARQQIAAAQSFRKEIAALWEACERWADDELEATTPSRPEVGEKGGSVRRLSRRLRPRSRG